METIINNALNRVRSKGEEYTCKELKKEFDNMWKDAEEIVSGKKKCHKGTVIFYKGRLVKG